MTVMTTMCRRKKRNMFALFRDPGPEIAPSDDSKWLALPSDTREGHYKPEKQVEISDPHETPVAPAERPFEPFEPTRSTSSTRPQNLIPEPLDPKPSPQGTLLRRMAVLPLRLFSN